MIPNFLAHLCSLRRWISAAFVVFPIAVASPPAAIAGGCLKDSRQIRLDKQNVVRLSEYLCRSDRDPQARIRVQFQRLSGLAAGAVLKGGKAPWLGTLYGRFRVVKNDMLDEYNTLLARFGSPVKVVDQGGGENTALFLELGTRAQAEKGLPSTGAKKGDEVRSFRLPDLPDIPLVDESLEILNQQTWPSSLNMYYASNDDSIRQPQSPMDEVALWRYLKPEDLKDYPSQLQRFNALIANREYGVRQAPPKSVQLLEYLTAGGWPDRFLYASAYISRSEACVPFEFHSTPYSFAVDIAVIENVSSKTIQIEQLFGQAVSSRTLRKTAGARQPTAEAALWSEPSTIAPAERLIVPLAFVLASEELAGRRDEAEMRKRSGERFRKIMASRPGTVFRSEVFSPLRGNTRTRNDTYVIRKVRESFKPPEYPEHSDFAFGPEWMLAGLNLAGEQIPFETFAPNFIRMTAGTETGSCPILYAWDRTDSKWVRHGKIIHKAQSRDRMGKETIAFSGLVDRFRIAEEELERATIHDISLQIDLADGRTLNLLRDPAPLRDATAPLAELYADEEIEISFIVPADVKADDVVRSSLSVTGYYDRYTALLLAAMEDDELPR